MEYSVEIDKVYSFKEILKLENGRKIAFKIARKYFIGNKVFSFYKGFGGTIDVVAILPSDNECFLFYMVDKNGKKHHFSDGFWFEILSAQFSIA